MELYNLTQMLPKDIDGGIIESPAARQYFTGFTTDSGYLIVSKNGSVFLTDSRYIEAAQAQIDCCVTQLLKIGTLETLWGSIVQLGFLRTELWSDST